MKTICAYCGTIIKDGPELVVSHGICKPCAEKEYAAMEAEEDNEQAQPHQ